MSENEMNTQPTAFEEPVLAKPKSKKGILIGVAALAVVAVVAAIVIGVLANSPLGLLVTGFQNSMKALESNSVMDMLNEVDNGGSMEVSMDLATLMQESGLPLGGTSSVKVYSDSEKEKAVVNVGVLLGGIQNLDATIYAGPESVILASEFLLGDKAYGVNLKNLEESFNSSVFGPNGPYSLDIELPENFQEQLDKYQDYSEATEKLGEQLASRLLKSLEKNSDVTKENDSLTLGGEDVKTTAVSVKMDHNQLFAVVEDMLEYLRTDKDFRAYIEEYADILFSNGMVDTDAMVEEFFQVLDETAEEMDELRGDLEEEEAGLEATFHITKSGKQLIGMELLLDSNVEPITISLVAGPDLEEAKEISFCMENGEEAYQVAYVVTANDKKEYASEWKILEDGETMMKLQTTWDKETGAWEIKTTSEGGFVIRGTLVQESKKTSLTLDSVMVEGQQTDLGIDIVLNASDKMPTAPNYTDVLKMTEAEVTGFISDLSMLFFQLALA